MARSGLVPPAPCGLAKQRTERIRGIHYWLKRFFLPLPCCTVIPSHGVCPGWVLLCWRCASGTPVSSLYSGRPPLGISTESLRLGDQCTKLNKELAPSLSPPLPYRSAQHNWGAPPENQKILVLWPLHDTTVISRLLRLSRLSSARSLSLPFSCSSFFFTACKSLNLHSLPFPWFSVLFASSR